MRRQVVFQDLPYSESPTDPQPLSPKFCITLSRIASRMLVVSGSLLDSGSGNNRPPDGRNSTKSHLFYGYGPSEAEIAGLHEWLTLKRTIQTEDSG